MARLNVPRFGDWETGEDNVPYTVYFEKARKNKGGKIINPSDPRENPEMFANTAFTAPAHAPVTPTRHRAEREKQLGHRSNKPLPKHKQESEEENVFKQLSDSPGRYRGKGRGSATESPYHQCGGGGTGSGRPSRQSTGSEHSVGRSPLHPNHQVRPTANANVSPAWDGKRSSETPHGTPGRNRIKHKPRNEAPTREVIPKFGTWDLSDPESADNYTFIFNQNAKGANSRDSNCTPSPHHSSRKHLTDNEFKFSQRCCFPWTKK